MARLRGFWSAADPTIYGFPTWGTMRLPEAIMGSRSPSPCGDWHLEYSSSTRIDDVIEIRTAVKAISGARITLLQQVTRGDEVLVRADVEVVMINSDGRARRLPQSVRHRLRAGHLD